MAFYLLKQLIANNVNLILGTAWCLYGIINGRSDPSLLIYRKSNPLSFEIYIEKPILMGIYTSRIDVLRLPAHFARDRYLKHLT